MRFAVLITAVGLAAAFDGVRDVARQDSKRDKEDCSITLFQAPYFTLGPTRTIWTSTETVTSAVPCGTCENVVVIGLPIGLGPVIFYHATTTAVQPSLTVAYVCDKESTGSPPGMFGPPVYPTTLVPRAEETRKAKATTKKPTPAPHSLWSQEEAYITTTVKPQGVAPTCTSKVELQPVVPDSTLTVYPSTVSVVSEVDCGGCQLEYWTGAIYFFAPVTLTETVTVATPSTKIDLGCEAKETGKTLD